MSKHSIKRLTDYGHLKIYQMCKSNRFDNLCCLIEPHSIILCKIYIFASTHNRKINNLAIIFKWMNMIKNFMFQVGFERMFDKTEGKHGYPYTTEDCRKQRDEWSGIWKYSVLETVSSVSWWVSFCEHCVKSWLQLICKVNWHEA